MLGIQSLAQLGLSVWQGRGGDIIRTNCGTKMVLPGLDQDTAEYVSKALGETTGRQEYQSRKPEGWLVTSYSYGEHHTQRRLMTADEVRRIGDDEALVLVSNLKPMRVRRIHWDEPSNPARVGSLRPERTMVVRESVGPPPPNNTEALRRELQLIEEEE